MNAEGGIGGVGRQNSGPGLTEFSVSAKCSEYNAAPLFNFSIVTKAIFIAQWPESKKRKRNTARTGR